ncbi:MAG: ATP-dependent zinc metalloprotease FtsH [Gemmataceae bacterium]
MAKNPGPERSRSWLSNPLILLLLLLLLPLLWLTQAETGDNLKLGYGQFKQVLQAPGVQLREVRVGPNDIRGKIVLRDAVSGAEAKQGDAKELSFRTPRSGLQTDMGLQKLLDEHIPGQYQADEDESVLKGLGSFFFFGLMLGAILLLTVFMFRMFSGAGGPFQFGRSKHKLYARKDNKVTFQDAAGIDEAVAELREVVDFLKRPQKYQALGGRIPKGVLLVGPPGTGKTLLAKAVAGEAEVPFFSLSGSDFVEMFVGVGASRVRDLFRDAESKAPCIIFIDELDALGRSRGGNTANPHEEREQTLNQLLVEMDGFDTNRGVIIMAATNRPEMLDVALLRPGRFDRTVVVDQPDINGREAILKVHTRHIKLGENVNLRRIASLTPGSVGADLANLVNEAALMAARKGKQAVDMADFDEAVERGAVGLERKSRIMKADEKRRVAFHEAGHALVACAVPRADPVHKVSIIPRGMGVGGYVLQRPEDDRFLMTRTELEANINVALGGTIAEELTFGEISTGATSDLDKANRIARRMVKEFGMSRLGRIFLREGENNAYLPSGLFGEAFRECSEETAREIDLEVRKIIDGATDHVRGILGRNRETLDRVASRLFEKEVIEGSELQELLQTSGFVPETGSPGVPVPSENGNNRHVTESNGRNE